MTKDKIFQKNPETQFEFNADVAGVFDDMINRSVPFYKETTDLVAEFIARLAKKGASGLDLGCSTGNTLLAVKERRADLALRGIDSAQAMIDKAAQKAKMLNLKIDFKKQDILNFKARGLDFIIANYTLQFIRPPKREDLVAKICNSLGKNGYFFLSEKIISRDKKLHKEMIEIYYDYKKKMGYSQYEITKKREALENVLIPYTDKENKKMLKNGGFKRVETIFRWNNFVSYIAIK
ncbi:MAG: carboxy-S-adenosyl-L-methionine synthase CmoA [Helicobacteraceae bacterium]